MNIFIMLAIVGINAIAILLTYQFIKKLPKMEKIIFIAVSFAIMYALVSIIYWISGFGINSKINEVAKDFITFIFVPINIILLIPFIAAKYNKYRFKEIKKEEFIKRIIIIGIIGIVILLIECFYFKNIKTNIKMFNNTMQENSKKEEINANEVNNLVTNIIKEQDNEINTTNIIKNEVLNVLE